MRPVELLHFAKEVEENLRQNISFSLEPREIDIDIMFYSDIVLQQEDVIIPHSRLAKLFSPYLKRR